ncbi:response regulator [Effusibacillus dendaii]|uniref:Transcriptional regulator n=1 Tax=Effusibacillus dendaii TaxID=2743772 RepID=A0A7I8D7L3_9BACL|nr:response regulator [Effusibacillus dendaii]BCJ86153.1 transcriptional regulator [Effusibacillus dendaii]
MKLRVYMIEDDAATRRMLERILQESDLAVVIGQAADGEHVQLENVEGADLILIDLLMPGRDGIETIRELKKQGFRGRFVMISQVENKQMVASAYQAGVDTFIYKPINRSEVLAVIRRVREHMALEQSLATIRKMLTRLDETPEQSLTVNEPVEQAIGPVFSQLGIAGEAGARDLLLLLVYLDETARQGDPFPVNLSMKELYQAVVLRTEGDLNEERLQKEIRAMEQRIRRAILHALGHLASLGLADYGNPIFEHYAPRLFDFQEVRQRMLEIEAGEKNSSCRIQIRKFLFGLYEELQAARRGK